MKVSVIIPAYNEADRIAHTVRAAFALPHIAEVVVVDDGSTDNTADVAEEAGATIVRQSNGGKASAMTRGASMASHGPLLFLDADLGATASEAHALIAPVVTGHADMTIATFPIHPGRGGGAGFVVRLSRSGILRATGRLMNAPLSGQRCMTRKAWDAAQPLAKGFGVETALTIDVCRAGLRVLEVPTQMDHRVTGKTWKARIHRLRQFRDVARALAPRLHKGNTTP